MKVARDEELYTTFSIRLGKLYYTFDHSLRKTFMSEYHSVKTKCSYLFVDSFDLVLALLNVTENLLKQCDNFYDISFHFIVQSWPIENHLVLSFPIRNSSKSDPLDLPWNRMKKII